MINKLRSIDIVWEIINIIYLSIITKLISSYFMFFNMQLITELFDIGYIWFIWAKFAIYESISVY